MIDKANVGKDKRKDIAANEWTQDYSVQLKLENGKMRDIVNGKGGINEKR